MGMRRTLIRQQGVGFVTKKNRVGAHKITEARGTANRRSTPEMRGTKTFLASIGVPKRILKNMVDGALYDVRYHFTKGFRVHPVRS